MEYRAGDWGCGPGAACLTSVVLSIGLWFARGGQGGRLPVCVPLLIS
jgi:hypothetical protein